MNAKRFFLLMLAFVMLLAFAACTDGDENGADDDHDDEVNPCIEAGCHELGDNCHCHGLCGVEGCACHGGH